MKIKKLLYTLTLLALMITYNACEKDFLEKKPRTYISDADVWNDPKLVEAFINLRYNQVGHGFPESWMSSVCDETLLTWSRGCEAITQGFVNPNDLGRMNGAWWYWDNRIWELMWRNIRDCNMILERIDDVSFEDKDYVQRLKGEVMFIRALMYFDLVQKWGGMPIITKAYHFSDIKDTIILTNVKRDTYEANVNFIVSQCDSAAKILPARYTQNREIGRATSIAALALKSRILLYAASQLMNDPRDDDPNYLLHYQTPDPNRWQRAADAADEAIDAAEAVGYKLYNDLGGRQAVNKEDSIRILYNNLFVNGPNNNEVIFDRQFYGSPEDNPYIDQANGPNGSQLWGGNCPIQEFVDDFEMADGTQFDWDNPVHAANPYDNRDPRLRAFVICDGDLWRGREVETHFYEEISGNDTVLKGGDDTDKRIDNQWNASRTGYYPRKFLDEEYVPNSWTFNKRDWVWFRLGELYLNYAEALYEIGDETGARNEVNKIRSRAKMPDIEDSGEELIRRIKNERRIELSYEEHRYFDIRRWKIAEDVMNVTATKVNIVKKLDGTKVYEVHTGDSRTVAEERTFNAPAMYWLPIPQAEIDKAPGLEQNPGY